MIDTGTRAAPVIGPGDVVRSLVGRDAGHCFFVLAVEGRDQRLLLVDGDIRKLACPKHKNSRHVAKVMRTQAEELPGAEAREVIRQAIREGTPLIDAQLRKALSGLTSPGPTQATEV